MDINGKNIYFQFRELESKGVCTTCRKELPKGTKVIRIRARQDRVSICGYCLDTLSRISNGETFGYTDEELKKGY